MKKFFHLFFFIFISTCSLNLLLAKDVKDKEEQINIVMDLGGVMLTTNKSKFVGHIGIWNGGKAWLHQDKMRKDMFNLMSAVKPRDNENEKVTDDKGLPLPQVMVDWMLGDLQGQEILSLIDTFIKDNPDDCKQYDTSLLKSIMGVMFDDEKFVDTQSLYPDALAFVKRCKERGFNIYALSNWPTSLDFLEEKYPEFFDLCDGSVLSCKAHILKPNPSIYDYFIEQTGCNPARTILIDDQIDNITGAKKAGWHGILTMKDHAEKPEFENVETALNKFVLSLKSKDKANQKPLVVINQEE